VTVLVDIVLPFGTLQRVGIYQKQPLAGAQKYSLPIFVTAMTFLVTQATVVSQAPSLSGLLLSTLLFYLDSTSKEHISYPFAEHSRSDVNGWEQECHIRLSRPVR
jgi:hypothetical protein